MGWLYFIAGLIISMIMEKFIFYNRTPKNTSDINLLNISIIRMSFIIIMFIIFLKLVRYLPIKGGIPFALIIMGIFMMVTNLNQDIRYLIDKYISKPIKTDIKIEKKKKHTS